MNNNKKLIKFIQISLYFSWLYVEFANTGNKFIGEFVARIFSKHYLDSIKVAVCDIMCYWIITDYTFAIGQIKSS